MKIQPKIMKLGCADDAGGFISVYLGDDSIRIADTAKGQSDVFIITKSQALQLIGALTIGIAQVWMGEGT